MLEDRESFTRKIKDAVKKNQEKKVWQKNESDSIADPGLIIGWSESRWFAPLGQILVIPNLYKQKQAQDGQTVIRLFYNTTTTLATLMLTCTTSRLFYEKLNLKRFLLNNPWTGATTIIFVASF